MYTLEDGSKVAGIPPKYSGWLMNKFGRIYWYQCGNLHRLDGPAYEGVNGSKTWYVKGKIHCIGGHAVDYGDGSQDWAINDKIIITSTKILVVIIS
jgi:hypothetical protein